LGVNLLFVLSSFLYSVFEVKQNTPLASRGPHGASGSKSLAANQSATLAKQSEKVAPPSLKCVSGSVLSSPAGGKNFC